MPKDDDPKMVTVTFRLSEKMDAKLREACSGLYAPRMSDLLRRGVELALKEMKEYE